MTAGNAYAAPGGPFGGRPVRSASNLTAETDLRGSARCARRS